MISSEPHEIFKSFGSQRPPSAPVLGRKITSEAVVASNQENGTRYPIPIVISSAKPKPAKKPKDRYLADISNKPIKQTHDLKPRFKSKTPDPMQRIQKAPSSKSIPKPTTVVKKPAVPRRSSVTPQPRINFHKDAPEIKQTPIQEDHVKSIDHIIQNSIKKQKVSRDLAEKKKKQLNENKEKAKKQLEKLNQETRKENQMKFKQNKFKPKIAWGVDERRINGKNDEKIRKESEEIRKRRREEIERTKSTGRARIGLDVLSSLLPNHRLRSHSNHEHSSTPEKKPVKEHNPEILLYMKQQKRLRKEQERIELERQREEENRRLEQLKRLEALTKKKQGKSAKKKLKPKKKSKSKKILKTYEEPQWVDESESNIPEDEEVLGIMEGMRLEDPYDYNREGRECKVFGHFSEEPHPNGKRDTTQKVNDIVEKRKKPALDLPTGSVTMPAMDVNDDTPVFIDSREEEKYKDLSSSDISKRKDGIKKKLAELRSRVEKAREYAREDSTSRSALNEEERKNAAIKIQAWVRGWQTREAIRHYLEEHEEESYDEEYEEHSEDNYEEHSEDHYDLYEKNYKGSYKGHFEDHSEEHTEERTEEHYEEHYEEHSEEHSEEHYEDQHSEVEETDEWLYKRQYGSDKDISYYEEEDEEVQNILGKIKKPKPINVESWGEEESERLETDPQFQRLSPVPTGHRISSQELEKRLASERKNLELAKKKQKEIETILKTQMQWRVQQKENLMKLKKKDLQDMQKVAEKLGTESGAMKIFQEIIDRRYAHLDHLFDENIEAVKAALAERVDSNDEGSLLRTFEYQKALASQLMEDQTNMRFDSQSEDIEKIISGMMAAQSSKETENEEIWNENLAESKGERSVRISELEIESSKIRDDSKSNEKSSQINVKNIPYIPSLPKHDISDSFIDQIKGLESPSNNSFIISPQPDRDEIYIESPCEGTITSEEPLVEDPRISTEVGEEPFLEFSHPAQISTIPTIPDEPSMPEFEASEKSESESMASFHSDVYIDSKSNYEDFESDLYHLQFNGNQVSSVENSDQFDSVTSAYKEEKKEIIDKHDSFDDIHSPPAEASSSLLSLDPNPPEGSIDDTSKSSSSRDILDRPLPANPKGSPQNYEIKDASEFETRIKKSPEIPRLQINKNSFDNEENSSSFQSPEPSPQKSETSIPLEVKGKNKNKKFDEDLYEFDRNAEFPFEPEDIANISEALLKQLLSEEIANAIKPEVPLLKIVKIDSQPSEPAVDTDAKAVQSYLEKLLALVHDNTEDIEYSLSTPVPNSPMDMLSKMQENEIGTAVIPDIPPAILNIDMYLEIEKQISDRSLDPAVQEAQHIHNKMIFDSFNESLQKHRIYGESGEPLPWSFDIRAIHHQYPNIKEICEKSKEEVLLWSSMQAGKVPILESNKSSGNIDEEMLQNIREDKLASMLALEVVERDHQWVNYEFEENQVKLDIADMVLEHLVTEVITILE